MLLLSFSPPLQKGETDMSLAKADEPVVKEPPRELAPPVSMKDDNPADPSLAKRQGPPINMTIVSPELKNATDMGEKLNITLSGKTSVVTAPNHGLKDGDSVVVRNYDKKPEMNDQAFYVDKATPDTFAIKGGAEKPCSEARAALKHLLEQTGCDNDGRFEKYCNYTFGNLSGTPEQHPADCGAAKSANTPQQYGGGGIYPNNSKAGWITNETYRSPCSKLGSNVPSGLGPSVDCALGAKAYKSGCRKYKNNIAGKEAAVAAEIFSIMDFCNKASVLEELPPWIKDPNSWEPPAPKPKPTTTTTTTKPKGNSSGLPPSAKPGGGGGGGGVQPHKDRTGSGGTAVKAIPLKSFRPELFRAPANGGVEKPKHPDQGDAPCPPKAKLLLGKASVGFGVFGQKNAPHEDKSKRRDMPITETNARPQPLTPGMVISVGRRRRPIAADDVVELDPATGLKKPDSEGWSYENEAGGPKLVNLELRDAQGGLGDGKPFTYVDPMRVLHKGVLSPLMKLVRVCCEPLDGDNVMDVDLIGMVPWNASNASSVGMATPHLDYFNQIKKAPPSPSVVLPKGEVRGKNASWQNTATKEAQALATLGGNSSDEGELGKLNKHALEKAPSLLPASFPRAKARADNWGATEVLNFLNGQKPGNHTLDNSSFCPLPPKEPVEDEKDVLLCRMTSCMSLYGDRFYKSVILRDDTGSGRTVRCCHKRCKGKSSILRRMAHCPGAGPGLRVESDITVWPSEALMFADPATKKLKLYHAVALQIGVPVAAVSLQSIVRGSSAVCGGGGGDPASSACEEIKLQVLCFDEKEAERVALALKAMNGGKVGLGSSGGSGSGSDLKKSKTAGTPSVFPTNPWNGSLHATWHKGSLANDMLVATMEITFQQDAYVGNNKTHTPANKASGGAIGRQLSSGKMLETLLADYLKLSTPGAVQVMDEFWLQRNAVVPNMRVVVGILSSTAKDTRRVLGLLGPGPEQHKKLTAFVKSGGVWGFYDIRVVNDVDLIGAERGALTIPRGMNMTTMRSPPGKGGASLLEVSTRIWSRMRGNPPRIREIPAGKGTMFPQYNKWFVGESSSALGRNFQFYKDLENVGGGFDSGVVVGRDRDPRDLVSPDVDAEWRGNTSECFPSEFAGIKMDAMQMNAGKEASRDKHLELYLEGEIKTEEAWVVGIKTPFDVVGDTSVSGGARMTIRHGTKLMGQTRFYFKESKAWKHEKFVKKAKKFGAKHVIYRVKGSNCPTCSTSPEGKCPSERDAAFCELRSGPDFEYRAVVHDHCDPEIVDDHGPWVKTGVSRVVAAAGAAECFRCDGMCRFGPGHNVDCTQPDTDGTPMFSTMMARGRCIRCDPECDGGCVGPGPGHCYRCKNYKHDNICVAGCPANTYWDQRLVQYQVRGPVRPNGLGQIRGYPHLIWAHCALDKQVCAFKGTQAVRYGSAALGWDMSEPVEGGRINCTAASFDMPLVEGCTGTDCAQHKVDQPDASARCEVVVEIPRTSKMWRHCAKEGEKCRSESHDPDHQNYTMVQFGSAGRYTILKRGPGPEEILCAAETFGVMPASHAPKSCFVETPMMSEVEQNSFVSDIPGAEPAAPQGWRDCSMENEDCAFKGLFVVRFGYGSEWVTAVAEDGIDCTVASFGADIGPQEAAPGGAASLLEMAAFEPAVHVRAPRMCQLGLQLSDGTMGGGYKGDTEHVISFTSSDKAFVDLNVTRDKLGPWRVPVYASMDKTCRPCSQVDKEEGDDIEGTGYPRACKLVHPRTELTVFDRRILNDEDVMSQLREAVANKSVGEDVANFPNTSVVVVSGSVGVPIPAANAGGGLIKDDTPAASSTLGASDNFFSDVKKIVVDDEKMQGANESGNFEADFLSNVTVVRHNDATAVDTELDPACATLPGGCDTPTTTTTTTSKPSNRSGSEAGSEAGSEGSSVRLRTTTTTGKPTTTTTSVVTRRPSDIGALANFFNKTSKKDESMGQWVPSSNGTQVFSNSGSKQSVAVAPAIIEFVPKYGNLEMSAGSVRSMTQPFVMTNESRKGTLGAIRSGGSKNVPSKIIRAVSALPCLVSGASSVDCNKQLGSMGNPGKTSGSESGSESESESESELESGPGSGSRSKSDFSSTVPLNDKALGEAASWATKAMSMQASKWSGSAAQAAASEAASTWVKATKGSVSVGADLAKAAASQAAAAGAWAREGKKVVVGPDDSLPPRPNTPYRCKDGTSNCYPAGLPIGRRKGMGCGGKPCKPVMYVIYQTGGCVGRNELKGDKSDSLEECYSRCDASAACVSFEYAKIGPGCQTSSSCTYDLSVKKADARFRLYVKNKDIKVDNTDFPHEATAKNVTALGAARFKRSGGADDEDDTAGDGWVTSLGTTGVVATEIGEVPPNRDHAIEGPEEDLQGLTKLE